MERMEGNSALDYAGSIVHRLEEGDLELLRGLETRRAVNVRTSEISGFEWMVRNQIMVEKVLLGPTSEGRTELEALEDLEKTLRKRKVIEVDPTSSKPHLERIVLTGDQITQMNDFVESYCLNDDHGRSDGEGRHKMFSFVYNMAKDYPNGQEVPNQGRIEKLFGKFGRQK